MRTAIIGLGLIGSQWARHLEQDGLLAAVWSRTKSESVSCFIPNLENIPLHAELLHVVVSDEIAALSVIEGLSQGLTSKHAVIQSTTIDPVTSSKLKKLVESKGAAYLECPFTGSLPAAQERKTVFYMGGEAQTVEQLTPYLRRLSHQQFHIGTTEQACMIKLAMNLQIASAMAALAEALTACREAGIDDETFFAVFRQNASFSGVAALKEPKLRAGDYSPQFSVKHMSKDMRLLSASLQPQPGMLATVRTLLVKAEEHGLADEDFSALIKILSE